MVGVVFLQMIEYLSHGKKWKAEVDVRSNPKYYHIQGNYLIIINTMQGIWLSADAPKTLLCCALLSCPFGFRASANGHLPCVDQHLMHIATKLSITLSEKKSQIFARNGVSIFILLIHFLFCLTRSLIIKHNPPICLYSL